MKASVRRRSASRNVKYRTSESAASGTARPTAYHRVRRALMVVGGSRIPSGPATSSRSSSFGSSQHVPGASQRGEKRLAFAFINLSAQSARVHIDDIRVLVSRIIPDLRHQLGAGDHPTRVSREMKKEGVFLRRERNIPAAPAHGMATSIDAEVADGQLRCA